MRLLMELQQLLEGPSDGKFKVVVGKPVSRSPSWREEAGSHYVTAKAIEQRGEPMAALKSISYHCAGSTGAIGPAKKLGITKVFGLYGDDAAKSGRGMSYDRYKPSGLVFRVRAPSPNAAAAAVKKLLDQFMEKANKSSAAREAARKTAPERRREASRANYRYNKEREAAVREDMEERPKVARKLFADLEASEAEDIKLDLHIESNPYEPRRVLRVRKASDFDKLTDHDTFDIIWNANLTMKVHDVPVIVRLSAPSKDGFHSSFIGRGWLIFGEDQEDKVEAFYHAKDAKDILKKLTKAIAKNPEKLRRLWQGKPAPEREEESEE